MCCLSGVVEPRAAILFRCYGNGSRAFLLSIYLAVTSRPLFRGRVYAVTSPFPSHPPHVPAKPKTLSRQKPQQRNIMEKHIHEIGALLGYYAAYSGNSGPVKMGQISCPETSVMNCHYTLRNTPEERRSDIHLGGSLKSRKPHSCFATQSLKTVF
jgi:hypothetical protein